MTMGYRVNGRSVAGAGNLTDRLLTDYLLPSLVQ
jgi:hypothetical protein